MPIMGRNRSTASRRPQALARPPCVRGGGWSGTGPPLRNRARDTFAAALVTELAVGTELRAAAVSAAFFAALKVQGIGRRSGIDAIPT